MCLLMDWLHVSFVSWAKYQYAFRATAKMYLLYQTHKLKVGSCQVLRSKIPEHCLSVAVYRSGSIVALQRTLYLWDGVFSTVSILLCGDDHFILHWNNCKVKNHTVPKHCPVVCIDWKQRCYTRWGYMMLQQTLSLLHLTCHHVNGSYEVEQTKTLWTSPECK